MSWLLLIIHRPHCQHWKQLGPWIIHSNQDSVSGQAHIVAVEYLSKVWRKTKTTCMGRYHWGKYLQLDKSNSNSKSSIITYNLPTGYKATDYVTMSKCPFKWVNYNKKIGPRLPDKRWHFGNQLFLWPIPVAVHWCIGWFLKLWA